MNDIEFYLDDYFFEPLIISCQSELWVNPDIEDICGEENIIDGEYVIDTYRITVTNEKTKETFWSRVKFSLFDDIIYDNNMTDEIREKLLEHIFCEFHLRLIDPEWIVNDEPFCQSRFGMKVGKILEDVDDLIFEWKPDYDVHLNLYTDEQKIQYN